MNKLTSALIATVFSSFWTDIYNVVCQFYDI